MEPAGGVGGREQAEVEASGKRWPLWLNALALASWFFFLKISRFEGIDLEGSRQSC